MTSAPADPTADQPAEAAPNRVSFEEFLARGIDEPRAEWVDGEVIPLSPASFDHQDLLKFLCYLVDMFVSRHGLGQVFFAPILMRLESRPSGREPDLLFVSNEHADRLRETYLDGPADLVVEIVSPDSDARDHGDKFVEYEAAGIPEYWLIDRLRQEAIFNVLGDDGRYHPAPIGEDGWFESRVLPGFRLQVAWLWQRPLPTLDDVRELIQA
jgi:Uma2 family endonuclease